MSRSEDHLAMLTCSRSKVFKAVGCKEVRHYRKSISGKGPSKDRHDVDTLRISSEKPRHFIAEIITQVAQQYACTNLRGNGLYVDHYDTKALVA
jgi:hypothetical protein